MGEMMDTLEVWEECTTVLDNVGACSTLMGEMMDTLEVWEECRTVLDTQNLW